VIDRNPQKFVRNIFEANQRILLGHKNNLLQQKPGYLPGIAGDERMIAPFQITVKEQIRPFFIVWKTLVFSSKKVSLF
jgi:hypothetical protein